MCLSIVPCAQTAQTRDQLKFEQQQRQGIEEELTQLTTSLEKESEERDAEEEANEYEALTEHRSYFGMMFLGL